MSALIFTTVLFFAFAFGESKFPGNKSPKSPSGNNVLSYSKSRGFNFDSKGVTRNPVGVVRGPKLEMQNAVKCNGKECASGEFRNSRHGKSKERNQIVIPLILIFDTAQMFLLGLAAVKIFFFKSAIAAKMAAFTFLVISVEKLLQLETLMPLKNHEGHFGNGLGQYPAHEVDLSGYGYEYHFVPGFQTPEQKYSSLNGKRRK